jgi:hypothetical protein
MKPTPKGIGMVLKAARVKAHGRDNLAARMAAALRTSIMSTSAEGTPRRPIVGTHKGLLLDSGYGPVTDSYLISLQRIVTGAANALSLITAEVGLDGVGTAFDWLSNPNEHIKIIVRPELTQTPGTP